MLRIGPQALPERAAAQLGVWQGQVAAAGDYAQRVAEARRLFQRSNTRRQSTFRAVRAALAELCAGARRCMYCEDSAADEVEHFRPKALYPDLAFAWDNYLYACGPCNLVKGQRFAVLRSRRLIEVTRPAGAPVQPPVAGAPAPIDPRHEDPLELLELDLRGTLFFVPRAAQGIARLRAEYTIELLGLNARDYVVEARREAYGSYRARLSEYARATASRRGRLVAALKGMGHPTVWAEMKRQQARLSELRPLFAAAPEALTW